MAPPTRCAPPRPWSALRRCCNSPAPSPSGNGAMRQPEFNGGSVEHCRVWLNWAAAQVDACIANDQLATEQLLASLGDFLGQAQPRSGAAPAPADDDIGGKLSAVIMAVQSHDR